ncbi:NUDIX hydrolase [Sulfurivermis fontis]|uniref:NUDIX hydrolase n=1 Tax=Sulfurivermis fontis TaxID=1972068 RepID=UPI000FDA5791|nr:NUDIX hydrolase [Sulfurivermis fontis]
MEIWKPHVTVASVLEQDGKFLLVEEEADGRVVYNQPAGHLEEDESPIAGAARETREETRYDFVPEALLGVYRWRKPDSDITYLRFAFTGRITGHDPARALDSGILRPVWLSRDEVAALGDALRSPLVLRCIDDYIAGKRYPLELLTEMV